MDGKTRRIYDGEDMKQYTQELFDLLHGSDQLLMADLYTIKLVNGTVLRYTNADMELTWGGNRYTLGPLLERTSTRVVLGLEVDTVDLTLTALGDGILLEGLPFIHAVAAGALDGASIDIDRAFLSDWRAPVVGTVNLFSGRVSTVPEIRRSSAKLELRSALELLDTKIPPVKYEAGCNRTEYSAGCGANKQAMTVAGSVTAASANGGYLQSGMKQAQGWFDMGGLTFTSGRNAGLTRTVKSYGNGLFRFALQLPYPPQAGDAFKVYPGCPKTKEACKDKFKNVIHFRGYPFVPPAEMAT